MSYVEEGLTGYESPNESAYISYQAMDHNLADSFIGAESSDEEMDHGLLVDSRLTIAAYTDSYTPEGYVYEQTKSQSVAKEDSSDKGTANQPNLVI